MTLCRSTRGKKMIFHGLTISNLQNKNIFTSARQIRNLHLKIGIGFLHSFCNHKSWHKWIISVFYFKNKNQEKRIPSSYPTFVLHIFYSINMWDQFWKLFTTRRMIILLYGSRVRCLLFSINAIFLHVLYHAYEPADDDWIQLKRWLYR